MKARRRQPRGAILIFVMILLVVLTIGAAAYFQVASASRATSSTVSGQQLATMHAHEAAQQAIADIRSETISLAGLTQRDVPLTMSDCASNCITHARVDNGTGGELAAGGGLQWDYMIYRSSQLGTPVNRYVVVATGYHGYTDTSASYAESRYEVEIDIGASGSGTLTSDDGSGMMSGR